MRYKYCPKCNRAYVKSRMEKDNCIYCNTECEIVDVKRNGMYYFGYSLMILGAASVFVPRVIEVTSRDPFIYLGIAMAIGGAVLIVIGSTKMASTAVDMVLSEQKEERD